MPGMPLIPASLSVALAKRIEASQAQVQASSAGFVTGDDIEDFDANFDLTFSGRCTIVKADDGVEFVTADDRLIHFFADNAERAMPPDTVLNEGNRYIVKLRPGKDPRFLKAASIVDKS